MSLLIRCDGLAVAAHYSVPAQHGWWQQEYMVRDDATNRETLVIYHNQFRIAQCHGDGAACRANNTYCKHARHVQAIWARVSRW